MKIARHEADEIRGGRSTKRRAPSAECSARLPLARPRGNHILRYYHVAYYRPPRPRLLPAETKCEGLFAELDNWADSI